MATVVVFNNTSCEHPETYKFVVECKKRVEATGIPFFFVQFQTYEDARQGEWRRIPSYRLVTERPFSEDNPDGFQWRGEVFEEMISYKAYLPNQFARVCTQSLKLEVTRQFLRDWFASKPSISRQGHGLNDSQVDAGQLYRTHIRKGGGVPEDVLLAKKRFMLSRPTSRPCQIYKDFSSPSSHFENPTLKGKVFGHKAWFGDGGIEYVAFIGLRGDEQLRVARVQTRSSNPHANEGYEGEHVYMPLAKIRIGKRRCQCLLGATELGPESSGERGAVKLCLLFPQRRQKPLPGPHSNGNAKERTYRRLWLHHWHPLRC